MKFKLQTGNIRWDSGVVYGWVGVFGLVGVVLTYFNIFLYTHTACRSPRCTSGSPRITSVP